MSTKIHSYEDLVAWQKAHALVLRIYQTTNTFPKEELFGLTSQLRRAAVSIPSNIVEGFGRWGSNEKKRFYNIAQASLKEAHYQLRLAEDLNYADTTDTRLLANEVERLIGGLIKGVPHTEKSSS
ncbi:four helix bundle protein [Rubritalea squalenifaciens DSM 18772]|uniref:Four helix bundle protein n=2 Tax=Rubritalea TaxID=361050 RepID=A0A1M6J4H9_9BACT|nr:four helix bundle protein [Rubritalea squalenifaciens]SHJ41547.1 four helix bundle protein [Rubritalea squalenifaciens DSM 18772]